MKARPLLMAAALVIWLPLAAGPLSGAAQAREASAAASTGWGTTVSFSGYTWAVKSGAEPVGPGPNVFSDSPENVWVDSDGQLHLRVTYRDGTWRCAEVVLDRSLGYGTYSFTIASPVGDLDPNVVLGLFTWSDEPAYNHREIDVELARWGDTSTPTNAQYVVQPYDRAGNLHRFVQPLTAPSAHSFTWAAKRVTFAGKTSAGEAIANWRYTGPDVPRAGGERARINLWLNRGMSPANGAQVEVVLSSFSFAR